MRERGLTVDHTTVWRWVQRYAPEINKKIRPHLKLAGASYRVDETYIKVGKSCKYLYRAVDSTGNTIEFMLSAKRDVPAAKRFFKKMMRADHRRLPFTISVDKNAAYPEAFTSSQDENVLPHDCKLRRVKYLNNIIEQDHRFIKKRVRACLGYRSFDTAERTLQGVEAMNMIRKGQVKRLDMSDAMEQSKFVAGLFQIAAWRWCRKQPSSSPLNLCNGTGRPSCAHARDGRGRGRGLEGAAGAGELVALFP